MWLHFLKSLPMLDSVRRLPPVGSLSQPRVWRAGNENPQTYIFKFNGTVYCNFMEYVQSRCRINDPNGIKSTAT